ncbi:hypothetical protein [Selenomonas ruminantium]|uniref:Uncharacterized protein n=1 Tax=Selenomonas ruminantium TaxID=971 RepID=A0A1H0PLN8_SELRU|nr:hypothetical protein [Selenomonas ruminantium]SDP05904.1 hypothetical protein SAMN05216366_10593 [Selenomonas ruminantium]
MLKRFIFVLAMFLALSSNGVAAAAGLSKIAVVPYVNATEETKDYVKDTIDDWYMHYFDQEDLLIVDREETETVLTKSGYDPDDMMLPSERIMAKVARQTGADYVVAMEVVNLKPTRHISFFSSKVNTTVRLKYHFYNAATDQMVTFQTTGVNNNKAVAIGFRSYKKSISDALQMAMEKGIDRMKGLI